MNVEGCGHVTFVALEVCVDEVLEAIGAQLSILRARPKGWEEVGRKVGWRVGHGG